MKFKVRPFQFVYEPGGRYQGTDCGKYQILSHDGTSLGSIYETDGYLLSLYCDCCKALVRIHIGDLKMEGTQCVHIEALLKEEESFNEDT